MPAAQLLSHLMVAATLLVAALTFAPSGAQAHAGHSHAARLDAQITAPITESAVHTQAFKVLPILQDEATVGQAGDQSAFLLPANGSDTPRTCPGGCCHSAGTGCCAVWLPASLEIFFPTFGRLTLIHAAIGGPGITPGALPEPPRSLV